MAISVYEFLYRGGDELAWSVTLGNTMPDGFGGTIITTKGPMTPEQAEALGFPLSTVIDGINSAALAQVAALQTQVFVLQGRVAELEAATTSSSSTTGEADQ